MGALHGINRWFLGHPALPSYCEPRSDMLVPLRAKFSGGDKSTETFLVLLPIAVFLLKEDRRP